MCVGWTPSSTENKPLEIESDENKRQSILEALVKISSASDKRQCLHRICLFKDAAILMHEWISKDCIMMKRLFLSLFFRNARSSADALLGEEQKESNQNKICH